MVETRTCQQCGAELPSDAPQGVCPYCVLKLGSGSELGGGNATAAYPPTSPVPAMEDLAALFPQLEIIGLVGRGGMGVVYKARQPSLDRVVALKILPPDVGRDPTFAERFNREARALAKLSHPNIVAIFDSGHTGGLYYLVMEYVDGVNLRQAILAEQITPQKALAIVPQICDALQYAHEEGVVHRDIKPENVLLDRKGRVKVADFGLAKLLGLAARDITLTGTSQAMGTLHYMAPEQYEKPQTVDHRADIYSLGVVFYELLTGRLPLGRFDLPSETLHVDVRLDEVVLKTLQREPERRYQYVSEVKTDVESIRREPPRPVATRFDGPAVASPAATGKTEISPTGRVLVTLGIAALACFPLVCVAGYILPRVFGLASSEVMILGVLAIFGLVPVGVVLIVAGLLSRRKELPRDASLPPEKEARATEADREAVERAVRGPALGLLLVAIAYWLPPLLILAFEGPPGSDDMLWPAILLGILQAATSLVMVLGAMKMRRLRFYPLAVLVSIIALVPFNPAWLIGLPIGAWALFVLTREKTRRVFASIAREEEPESKGATSPLGCLLVAGCALVPLLLVLALLASYSRTEHQVVVSPHDHSTHGTTTDTTTPDPQFLEAVTWTADGPHLGRRFEVVSFLRPEQVDAINKALENLHRDYMEVERTNTQRSTNDRGRQVIVIAPFIKELEALENAFWTEADKIATSDSQRGQLRQHLNLRGEILPFGTTESKYEIWRVGSWYHFTQPFGGEVKGPELPRYMQHLWQPPEAPKPAEIPEPKE